MKYSWWLSIAWIGLSSASAQKIVEKHIDFSQKSLLVLNIQIADSIRVHTWDKPEVYVRASIDINDNKDNDLYKTQFGDSGNTVGVVAKMDFEKARRISRDSGCCCGVYVNNGDNHCIQSHIAWEVYLPKNTDFTVESINANLIIAGRTAGIRAHLISGFIDLSVAPEWQADLKLSTISGTVYSNLAMNIPARSSHDAGTRITDQVNGGGKPVNLETISGNIFLRKAD